MSPHFQLTTMSNPPPTSQHNPTLDLFNNSKLNLDMSFNRHPQGRFACDIDPLSQDPLPLKPPTPTFQDVDPTEAELADTLLEWKFPIRTDYARGLIWGPFKHCRGNSWSSELDASSQLDQSNPHSIQPPHQQQYSCDRSLDIPVLQNLPESDEHPSQITPQVELTEPFSPQPLPKVQQQEQQNQQSQPPPSQQQQQPAPVRLQKIFPILRSPIVIRIKPLSVSSTSTTTSNPPSKRRRQSSRTDSFKSCITSPRILHFGHQPHQQKKSKFVQVAISVDTLNPSRIKLCPTSRLKYGH